MSRATRGSEAVILKQGLQKKTRKLGNVWNIWKMYSRKAEVSLYTLCVALLLFGGNVGGIGHFASSQLLDAKKRHQS